ncbi:two-component system OmpR family response regulator/two-component system response regulator QseB [Idiomarina fontislapidosi]|uniref:DNA-binding response regulator n=1 Tax=Idiomarina fontislapidosi TaxID=263723 RepID=A0A432Y9B1_9GAMM|nr:response regulator transcription factor [Idiomarina fontislapidosi]PYE34600.1 two-component system OmpR family response regulator/two-component system response regulator QseB [Idiomarina fontislapidosi]RUO57446.1 DNA-binding response regulator [Idiomarina fontislapidosi]
MQLLLVEDNQTLGQAVEIGLSQRQFMVSWVRTGAAAISNLNRHEFDIAILDLGLPDIEGERVLQSIRRKGIDIPILVLTARDQTRDVINLLDAGADDFMTKPFDVNELAARLRALLRRRSGYTSAKIACGPIVMDTSSREAFINGREMMLSRKEYELLQMFVMQPMKVHPRDKLEALLSSDSHLVESNALEVHVHNLRKKLGQRELIETIRGVGYRLKCKD